MKMVDFDCRFYETLIMDKMFAPSKINSNAVVYPII